MHTTNTTNTTNTTKIMTNENENTNARRQDWMVRLGWAALLLICAIYIFAVVIFCAVFMVITFTN